MKIYLLQIDWLNGVLRCFQQYFSHITATAHIIHVFLGFTSARLGSEVSCPRTLPRKNPEDLVQLEPRTPGLRVEHFTTEPRGTLDLLQQVVFKCRLYLVDLWRSVVPEQWSLKAVDCLIQVTSNAGLTVFSTYQINIFICLEKQKTKTEFSNHRLTFAFILISLTFVRSTLRWQSFSFFFFKLWSHGSHHFIQTPYLIWVFAIAL